MRSPPPVRWIAVALLVAWCAALVLPVAVLDESPGNTFYGWMVLVMGWMGFFVGQFAWIANLLVFSTLLVVAVAGQTPRDRTSIVIGWLLVGLGINGLFWREMVNDNGTTPIAAFGAGYYLWFASVFGSAALLLLPRSWLMGR